jgi:hypothetical protein
VVVLYALWQKEEKTQDKDAQEKEEVKGGQTQEEAEITGRVPF